MVTITNNPYLYLKGTCNVNVQNPSTGDVVYQSSKIATNNFTTETDMGAIRAGLGNPIAIQLPAGSAVNLELTTVDFSLQSRAMQVGSQVKYNGIAPVCTTVVAAGSILTVPNAEPVAGYGFGKAYAHVNFAGAPDPGKAYEINENGQILGFAAAVGTTYQVIYYERRADVQELGISGMFSPGIYTVTAQMAVFSTEGANAGNRGSQVGWAYYHIPRMQFSGNANTNGNQSEAATSTLSGTALSFEDAAAQGVCTDCSFPMLAYMTYVPLVMDTENAIQGLVVVGGEMEIAKGSSQTIPFKYAMIDETLVQPKYSDFNYSTSAEGTATVENGVVTGVSAGKAEITITNKTDSSISIVVPVTVGGQ